MDPLRADVSAMRGKLAEVAREATNVAGHLSDWQRLGVEPHMPAEMSLVRLEVLDEALWAVVKEALDARLAVACVRARVEARTAENGPGEDAVAA